jgi:hypothetical protein
MAMSNGLRIRTVRKTLDMGVKLRFRPLSVSNVGSNHIERSDLLTKDYHR